MIGKARPPHPYNTELDGIYQNNTQLYIIHQLISRIVVSTDFK